MKLLSPAGSPRALQAALWGGADEVYLGLDAFNARRNAENFRLETLEAACDQAHLRGASVNLTLNTLLFDSELEPCLKLAREAWLCGVDAFIVADLGLIRSLRTALPDARLHFSTQMSATCASDIRAAHQWGASRVTLARELSLEEIRALCALAEPLGLEIEVFAHGALCVCYSGQCLLSSMIGGRSANRGLCAQACRLPYKLIENSGENETSTSEKHWLSPKDLCLVDSLDSLADAGVSSIKIEGRMKSPDYVASVTSVYRNVLDRVNEREESAFVKATAEEKASLEEAFSRGFTEGFMAGERGNAMMSYDRPNNRGVAVGRVISADDKWVTIKINRPLGKGDVLEVWTGRGRERLRVSDDATDSNHPLRLELSGFRGRLSKGDRVFRVSSASQRFSCAPADPRVPVLGLGVYVKDAPLEIAFYPGDRLSPMDDNASRPSDALESTAARYEYDSADLSVPPLTVAQKAILRRFRNRYGLNAPSVMAEGSRAQEARTKALTPDEFAYHINRLGQTDFDLQGLRLTMDSDLGLGFSAIHHGRDEALTNLSVAILEPWKHRLAPKMSRSAPTPSSKTSDLAMPSVAAIVSNGSRAAIAKEVGIQTVYIGAEWLLNQEAYKGGVVFHDPNGSELDQCGVLLPAIGHDAIGAARETTKESRYWHLFDGSRPAVVNSLGALDEARKRSIPFEVGSDLPLLNRAAFDVVQKAGARGVWLSPELTLNAIKMLASETPLSLTLTVIGAQRLMTTEHCLLMSIGTCGQNCAQCQRRRYVHHLKDAQGYEFPVLTDPLGRSHLYNAVPLDIVPWMGDLYQAGVTRFVVDTTLMTSDEAVLALRRAQDGCRHICRSERPLEKQEGTTTGHLFRGPR